MKLLGQAASEWLTMPTQIDGTSASSIIDALYVYLGRASPVPHYAYLGRAYPAPHMPNRPIHAPRLNLNPMMRLLSSFFMLAFSQ